jgi:amino acid transporter
VGEALKLTFVITAVAVVALILFVVAMLPSFSTDNLFDIAATDAAGASDFLPFGFAGVLAAFVYGIWFFLAIEGCRWQPRKHGTRDATCPAASSSRCSSCSSSLRSCS